ncbi:hypothetical protein KIH39_04180 [Telmatocola sphagniphila]|uniref:DUF3365 domain-containing protein n=1 Tax=Telmatocola sphagniphila TaxID=1123043 RepID=A0A8E6B7F1_9BACT|nr:hypothetical protein [Telmatocola sphagniphila]QVL33121.1 hypothetical protein KIH39_04180 [Telmatocola sphagniphila]
MKTIITSLCFLSFVAIGYGQNAKPKSQIMILENEGIFEGEITQEGDWYHIKRLLGETVVPTDRVLKIVDNITEAYKYLVRRANLSDPDEQIRLTKWCMTYDLRQEAVGHAEATLKLVPENTYAKYIIRSVKEMPPVPAAQDVKKVVPVVVETNLPPDFNQESLGVFVTRVQPIMMNTCASCHVGHENTKFVLQRVYAGTDRRTSLINLQAVLKYLDRNDVAKSPFLTNSIAAHGNLKNSPLRGKESAPYRHLEEWARNAFLKTEVAAADVSQIPQSTAAEEAQPLESPKPVSRPLLPRKTNSARTESASPATSTPATTAVSKTAEVKETPKATSTKPTEPIDPFDPEEFNKKK